MEKINTIKEMYKEDRPYEKCEKFGAENLTDTELLAILIRTGTKGENSLELSRKLLYKNGFHNGLAGIHKWSLDELIQIKGIGKVKAIQLVCLSELSKRLARTSTVGKLDFIPAHDRRLLHGRYASQDERNIKINLFKYTLQINRGV